MSIEFVEPDEIAPAPDAAAAAASPARARPRAVAGRVLAAATLVAAVLTGFALRASLYSVTRTVSIVDFDRTLTQVAHLPVDAFGHATPVMLPLTEGVAERGGDGTVSAQNAVGYGHWWLGLAIALAVVAVWAALRPRSTAPAAFVAALGGLLLGSVGAAWLAIRTVADDSVAQLQFVAEPGRGLWLAVAAGGLALVAGLLRATNPPLRRLLPRRRAR